MRINEFINTKERGLKLNKRTMDASAALLEEKIQSVINMLESTNIINHDSPLQYQKRFYRIYKSLLSISKHSDAIVSSFDYEENHQEASFKSEAQTLLESYQTENSSSKEELNQLLHFIQTKLTTNLLHQSSDEALDSNAPSLNNEINYNALRKQFFKIELMLKSYLEEQRISNSNSKSSSNQSNSIKNKRNSPLPNVVSNFFKDKETLKQELENTHKRYSAVNTDINCQLKTNLNKGYFINFSSFKKNKLSWNSEVVKLKPQLKKAEGVFNTEVSNFNLNLNNDHQNTHDHQAMSMINFKEDISQFKITKRNSLFEKKQHLDESNKLSTLLEKIEEDN